MTAGLVTDRARVGDTTNVAKDIGNSKEAKKLAERICDYGGKCDNIKWDEIKAEPSLLFEPPIELIDGLKPKDSGIAIKSVDILSDGDETHAKELYRSDGTDQREKVDKMKCDTEYIPRGNTTRNTDKCSVFVKRDHKDKQTYLFSISEPRHIGFDFVTAGSANCQLLKSCYNDELNSCDVPYAVPCESIVRSQPYITQEENHQCLPEIGTKILPRDIEQIHGNDIFLEVLKKTDNKIKEDPAKLLHAWIQGSKKHFESFDLREQMEVLYLLYYIQYLIGLPSNHAIRINPDGAETEILDGGTVPFSDVIDENSPSGPEIVEELSDKELNKMADKEEIISERDEDDCLSKNQQHVSILDHAINFVPGGGTVDQFRGAVPVIDDVIVPVSDVVDERRHAEPIVDIVEDDRSRKKFPVLDEIFPITPECTGKLDSVHDVTTRGENTCACGILQDSESGQQPSDSKGTPNERKQSQNNFNRDRKQNENNNNNNDERDGRSSEQNGDWPPPGHQGEYLSSIPMRDHRKRKKPVPQEHQHGCIEDLSVLCGSDDGGGDPSTDVLLLEVDKCLQYCLIWSYLCSQQKCPLCSHVHALLSHAANCDLVTSNCNQCRQIGRVLRWHVTTCRTGASGAGCHVNLCVKVCAMMDSDRKPSFADLWETTVKPYLYDVYGVAKATEKATMTLADSLYVPEHRPNTSRDALPPIPRHPVVRRVASARTAGQLLESIHEDKLLESPAQPQGPSSAILMTGGPPVGLTYDYDDAEKLLQSQNSCRRRQAVEGCVGGGARQKTGPAVHKPPLRKVNSAPMLGSVDNVVSFAEYIEDIESRATILFEDIPERIPEDEVDGSEEPTGRVSFQPDANSYHPPDYQLGGQEGSLSINQSNNTVDLASMGAPAIQRILNSIQSEAPFDPPSPLGQLDTAPPLAPPTSVSHFTLPSLRYLSNFQSVQSAIQTLGVEDAVRAVESLPAAFGLSSFGAPNVSLQGKLGHDAVIDSVRYGTRHNLVACAKRWSKLRRRHAAGRPLPKVDKEEGVVMIKELSVTKQFRYAENYQWMKVSHLGSGVAGKCHLAYDLVSEFEFCVKVVDISNYYEDELILWSDLEHPGIVKLFGAIRYKTEIHIFSEVVLGGNLSKFVADNGCLSQWQSLSYYRQLLEVLQYLMRKRVLHEDLKGDNILLRDGCIGVAVTDFGLARKLPYSQDAVNPGKGPVGAQTSWSPEKAASEGYDYGSEVWAVTCVLVEMLSGYHPWVRRFGEASVLHYIIKFNSPPVEDIPEEVHSDIKDLMMKAWTVEPEKRPLAGKLLDHHAFHLLDRPEELIVFPVHQPDTWPPEQEARSDATLERIREQLELERASSNARGSTSTAASTLNNAGLQGEGRPAAFEESRPASDEAIGERQKVTGEHGTESVTGGQAATSGWGTDGHVMPVRDDLTLQYEATFVAFAGPAKEYLETTIEHSLEDEMHSLVDGPPESPRNEDGTAPPVSGTVVPPAIGSMAPPILGTSSPPISGVPIIPLVVSNLDDDEHEVRPLVADDPHAIQMGMNVERASKFGPEQRQIPIELIERQRAENVGHSNFLPPFDRELRASVEPSKQTSSGVSNQPQSMFIEPRLPMMSPDRVDPSSVPCLEYTHTYSSGELDSNELYGWTQNSGETTPTEQAAPRTENNAAPPTGHVTQTDVTASEGSTHSFGSDSASSHADLVTKTFEDIECMFEDEVQPFRVSPDGHTSSELSIVQRPKSTPRPSGGCYQPPLSMIPEVVQEMSSESDTQSSGRQNAFVADREDTSSTQVAASIDDSTTGNVSQGSDNVGDTIPSGIPKLKVRQPTFETDDAQLSDVGQHLPASLSTFNQSRSLAHRQTANQSVDDLGGLRQDLQSLNVSGEKRSNPTGPNTSSSAEEETKVISSTKSRENLHLDIPRARNPRSVGKKPPPPAYTRSQSQPAVHATPNKYRRDSSPDLRDHEARRSAPTTPSEYNLTAAPDVFEELKLTGSTPDKSKQAAATTPGNAKGAPKRSPSSGYYTSTPKTPGFGKMGGFLQGPTSAGQKTSHRTYHSSCSGIDPELEERLHQAESDHFIQNCSDKDPDEMEEDLRRILSTSPSSNYHMSLFDKNNAQSGAEVKFGLGDGQSPDITNAEIDMESLAYIQEQLPQRTEGVLLQFVHGSTRKSLAEMRIRSNHNITWEEIILRASSKIHESGLKSFTVYHEEEVVVLTSQPDMGTMRETFQLDVVGETDHGVKWKIVDGRVVDSEDTYHQGAFVDDRDHIPDQLK